MEHKISRRRRTTGASRMLAGAMLALVMLTVPTLAASAAQIDIPQPGDSIEIPTISVPDVQIPEVTIPEIPEVTVPEVPTVDVPTVDVPTIDVPSVEVPSALETCQAQFPDAVTDVSTMVDEALADSGLSEDVVAQILELVSVGDLTCEDLFPA